MHQYTNSMLRQKRIDEFDVKSKYIVNLIKPNDYSKALFEYSEYFYEAARIITEYILYDSRKDIRKLDTYIFPITFLYRHCIELGLKAICFQTVQEQEERKILIRNTRHSTIKLFEEAERLGLSTRKMNELEWLREYLYDLSQKDKDSDSFRYPFHIYKSHDWEAKGEYIIRRIFDKQTHIDFVKFVNKFIAAYEIIDKWYKHEEVPAKEWKQLNAIFIECGGDYYSKSVVGHEYGRDDFYSYTRAYMECANYLKKYMKDKTDLCDEECKEHLFLPMCYLYRNCVELNLKAILFEELDLDFQKKCKLMCENKHKIIKLWSIDKACILDYFRKTDKEECLVYVDNCCKELNRIDKEAITFRYPFSKDLKPNFSKNKRFDFWETGEFFEAMNVTLDWIDAIVSDINEIKKENGCDWLL